MNNVNLKPKPINVDRLRYFKRSDDSKNIYLNMKRVLLTHPTGNGNVRALIEAFVKNGLIAEFNTTISANPKNPFIKLLPSKIRQELLRRSFPISPNHLWTHPYLELARMVLPKLGLRSLVANEFGWASVYAVYKEFDKATAQHLLILSKTQQINAVYAYEDGALNTFAQAKNLGLKCIYDLPIAYWETGRALMLEEMERLPLWASTLGGGVTDSKQKLDCKVREMEHADMIVVPSQFVKDSLPKWALGKKIVMAPFGTPSTIDEIEKSDEKNKARFKKPLRVLFVGSMGQRKGLGDLFNAIKMINPNDIELVVMGSILAPLNFYKKELSNFIFEPGRPHKQVLELMDSCDVFCLPSIVEGRALVMQEAMSKGLPLIITRNTGGEDLIIEGETGFLVPIRSPEAIAEKLTWFLENRSKIPAMGKRAKEHAARYSWENYGAIIIDSINNMLKFTH